MGAPTEDERRRTILECAERLFGHYGHAKTTIADIAREAGIGVGTVYLAFPSKEAIVEELSSSAHVRVLGAMRAVAEERAHETFAERLSGVLEVRVTTFLDLARGGQHACDLLHCKSGKSSPITSAHARFLADERALLVAILEDARASGSLAEIDTKRTAALLQRAYATLSPPWLYEQPTDEARRAAHEMCRLLLLGLVDRDAHAARDARGTTRRKRR